MSWARSHWRGIVIATVSFLVGAAIGAAGAGDNEGPSAAQTVTVQTTVTAEAEAAPAGTTEAPEASEEEPQAAPKAPPRVLRGRGARVVSVTVAADSPLVVAGAHSGSSNFIVELVSPETGSINLFNEIGRYSGETAVEDAAAGRYRVKVDADGSWTLTFTQPVPTPKAKSIPGTIKGRGAMVIQIRTEEDLQPIIRARHRGQSNFIVDVIGYGGLTGSENLFNEIGNFSGETLLEEMPAGPYLLHVQADGPWTLTFSR